MRLFLLFTLILGAFYLQAQHVLDVRIDELPPGKVYLANFYGEENYVLDSISSDSTGSIVFDMKQSYFDGMYRITFNKNYHLDFIFGHEDILLETHFMALIDSMKVIQSTENQLYFDFLKKMRHYYVKLDLLTPLVTYYPEPRDPFYYLAESEYINIQQNYIDEMKAAVKKYPELYVSKVLQQQIPLYIEPGMSEKDRLEYIKDHFFDNISFNEPDLLRSNIYSSKSIEYLSFYSNPGLTQEQLEDEFILAVDRIMEEAAVNSMVYEFVIEYLVGGFEKYHFDGVLDYIAEHYDPEQCENQERKTDLTTRLEKYAELSIGKQAPDFVNIDVSENEMKLSALSSSYTILIFWASWCPHCNEIMPMIAGLYQQFDDPDFLEVYTVSLDTSRSAWNTAVEKWDAGFVNTCDGLGWDSEAALAYNIYATPTMFILDEEKKIIAKPITYEGLISDMIKEGIISSQE